MDIWGHFETNVVKVGVQGCPEVGTLENPTSLWCGKGPQGFQPLRSHPKVGTQSFSRFILVRYSLVVPFLCHQSLEQHLSGQGNVTIASSRIQACRGRSKTWKTREKASPCPPPFPLQTSLLEQDPARVEKRFSIFAKMDRICKTHLFLKMCCCSI